ncbi:MAG: hypothetical protein AB9869_16610 [Verrucomicrobiia bacterium]
MDKLKRQGDRDVRYRALLATCYAPAAVRRFPKDEVIAFDRLRMLRLETN